jgi:hypothetical protein
MDDGICAEIDDPVTLLQNSSSLFHQLVLRGGKQNLKKLLDLANKGKQSRMEHNS